MVCGQVDRLLGHSNFGMEGANVPCRGLPLRRSGRAGYPSRDSDPLAQGCLSPASQLGVARADAVRQSRWSGRALRVREGVAGLSALPGRGEAVMLYLWPRPVRAWPCRISSGRAGGKIQSSSRQRGELAIVSP